MKRLGKDCVLVETAFFKRKAYSIIEMHVAHGPLRCGKSCRKCDYFKLGLCTGCRLPKRNLCLVYQCVERGMRKVAEEENPDFPKKVKDYLDERFKGEPFYQPYEVRLEKILGRSLEKEKLKWSVQSWGFSCYSIEEDVKGQIWIVSDAIESNDGWAEDYRIDASQLELLLKDLQNKRNWRKYNSKYRGLMAMLRFEERIARLVTKKTGVRVSLFIPPNFYFKYCHFYSVFDANNMTDDQKMEEIKKRVDAIFLAYKYWDEGKKRLYRRRRIY